MNIDINVVVWDLSRPLGQSDIGIDFQPRELLATAVANLQRGWRAGQTDG
jgi:hypothetical protein